MSKGIAMREGDPEETLRLLARWNSGARADAPFLHDPMPSRISSAFASLQFGREPEFGAAVEGDQARLDAIADENNFTSEVHRMARTKSSEGEVWWRAYVDKTMADVPLLEWHSRTSVYPLWRGIHLVALAFVSRLYDLDDQTTYRHFEVHELSRDVEDPEAPPRGRVENVLYAASDGSAVTAGGEEVSERRVTKLGERVPLARHPETEHLLEEWNHGLPSMLGGRVVNRIESDPTLGVGDYHDPEDFLTELDVCASIGHQNLDLTARRRVIVPEAMVDEETGAADLGEQVLVQEPLERSLGDRGASQGAAFKVLEYTFDADALIAYKRETERTALNRCGIDAQYAGIDPAEGQADTGIALRIKLIPSVAAGEERAQDVDDKLPRAVAVLQMLDQLPAGEGGFGRSWSGADRPPEMERGATLPEDRTEATDRRVAAVAGHVMGHVRAIMEDDPELTEEEARAAFSEIVDEEKQLAEASASSFGASIPPDNTFGSSADGEGVQSDGNVAPQGDAEAAAGDQA